MSWLTSVNLSKRDIRLEPLSLSHLNELQAAVKDGELWKLWFTSVPKPDDVKSYIEAALEQKKATKQLAFAVIDKQTNQAIGSTRYCNVDSTNRRLEVGYTWYAKRYQKTATNTICKYLLLTHAFEQLNCIAVEFRTHWHNQASRQAIARLGAKQDGVLRQHQQMPDGSYRDTVVFSILNSEWSAVKKNLELKLSSRS
ncbi:MAG: GNAT family N-acetyltransferase [Gammaproteobacteria bacterium]|nr:GNAT family N-acetyltransferase [Gammaproteobacteria bacterium]